MTVVLDDGRFSTPGGFYEEVNRLLAPSIEMGHNLGALWDVLRGDLGGPEGPVILVWKNARKSRRDLGPTRFEQVREVLGSHPRVYEDAE